MVHLTESNSNGKKLVLPTIAILFTTKIMYVVYIDKGDHGVSQQTVEWAMRNRIVYGVNMERCFTGISRFPSNFDACTDSEAKN